MNFNTFGKKESLAEDLKLPDDRESERGLELTKTGISPLVLDNPIFRDVILEKLYQFKKEDSKNLKDAHIFGVVYPYIPKILEAILKAISDRRKTLGDEKERYLDFEDLNLDIVPGHELVCREFFTSIKNLDEENPEIELVLNIRKRIESTSSFGELYEVLNTLQEIPSSQRIYSCDEIISIINKVRNKELGIKKIPRTYGLREKVEELLKLEN